MLLIPEICCCSSGAITKAHIQLQSIIADSYTELTVFSPVFCPIGRLTERHVMLYLSPQVRYHQYMRAIYFRIFICLSIALSGTAHGLTCAPTEPDALGPFYQPDAPVRSHVGKGYVLTGTVKSTAECMPIPNAKIEIWMAGPDGEYADAYRATLFSDSSGAFRFESHIPPPYYGRRQHIHILVSAAGFRTLVTQHYPEKGKTAAVFDLVIMPK